MPTSLFVYGSLRRTAPGRHHPLLRDARYVGAASISGSLYDLGRYSCIVRDSTRRRVFGELYDLPGETAQRTLRALDRYEGAEFARQRVYATLRDGTRRAAWAYVLRGRPPESARRIESGRYPRVRA